MRQASILLRECCKLLPCVLVTAEAVRLACLLRRYAASKSRMIRTGAAVAR